MKTRAAGICLRHGREGLEVLLVRSSNKRWIFPKGKIEPAEHPVRAARREVQEEAGWLTEPCQREALGWIEGDEDEPRTEFYLLKAAHSCGPGEYGREPSWVPVSRAYTYLSATHDVETGIALSNLLYHATTLFTP